MLLVIILHIRGYKVIKYVSENKRQPFQNNYEVISPNRLPYSAVKVTLFKFSLKKVVSLSRGHVVGNTHLDFGFSMSGLKLNIISTALQAF